MRAQGNGNANVRYPRREKVEVTKCALARPTTYLRTERAREEERSGKREREKRSVVKLVAKSPDGA